jgi:LacI family transcriptional regulator, galactose operon repressor
VRGMDREASRRGYLLLLSNLHGRKQQAVLALQAMRGRVDGLVVMAPQLSEPDLAQALPAALPALLVNTRAKDGGRPSIHLDNAAGAHAVVDHLVHVGRKYLVHIAGPDGNIDAQERSDAFRDVCTRHRVRCEIVPGDFTEESGVGAIEKLLRDGRAFDAIFASNDNMAIGALQALRSAGLRVPQDVAVAGFDDVPLAKHLGLTTVRVRIAELGERALVRLLAIIGDEDGGGDELHAPELVVRASTDQNAA